jgi:hypothetical protein
LRKTAKVIEEKGISMSNLVSEISRMTVAHFAGCLLGGAVGDALGAPVEFDSIHAIRRQYGPEGIKDYDAAYSRRGTITDDTQMTLFTAEGLLRAGARWRHKGICHPASVIHHAYIRSPAHAGRAEPVTFLARQAREDGRLVDRSEKFTQPPRAGKHLPVGSAR